MARPIVLGVVGDSGAGKTTLTRGLLRVLGAEHAVRLNADDYHRYDRRRRTELGVTPLDPEANHLDILTQHLLHLRRGEPVLKPVYNHRHGTLEPPAYLRPVRFVFVEGLLSYHTETLRTAHDIRVFLDPPEDLRRSWKLKRDCTRRNYTTDEVLAELDRREHDAELFIRPQRDHADILISFRQGADPDHLDVDVILRDTLPHPDADDLLPLIVDPSDGGSIVSRAHDRLLRIPGNIDSRHAAELEETIWSRMSFANHLRVRRLGEFAVGTDLHRSDSLALVQLLILYHLMWGRLEQASGEPAIRQPGRRTSGDDSALFL